jgi:hypothetical protein
VFLLDMHIDQRFLNAKGIDVSRSPELLNLDQI